MLLALGRMAVERISNLRMRLNELVVQHQELKYARCIERHEIQVNIYFRYNRLNNHTDIGQLLENLADPRLVHSGTLGNSRHGINLHRALDRHQHRNLLIGNPLLQRLVLRAFRSNVIVAVINLTAQFQQILSRFHLYYPLMPTL